MKHWAAVRAGLIALAIALGLVDGCPIPPLGEARPWQRPIVETVQPVQRAALSPFAWITRHLRFSQRWALFQSADRERFRFVVEGRRAGAWSTLYRAGDGGTYEGLLEHRRIRGAWNPTDHTMSQYGGFATWFLQRVLDEHAELDAVRIRHEKVLLDGGTVTDTGEFVFDRTLPRGRR